MQNVTRASTARSRNGCATCKIRRVKCDEAAPECVRCTSTGRKCDGYPERNPGNQLLGINHGAAQNTSPPPKLPLMATTRYSIPFKVRGSQRDRRMLHYYCVQGAADLAGYVQSDFWIKSLLLASHGEPVVRKALVTLSAGQFFFETRDQDGKDRESRYRSDLQVQYMKAVRGLRKYIANTPEPSKIAVLQCCICFYSFESLRGDHTAALKHLQNGLSILRSVSSQREMESSSPNQQSLTELNEIFFRMDLQATLFDDGRIPAIQQEQVSIRTEKVVLTTIPQARSSLHVITNQLSNLLTANTQHKYKPLQDIPESILQRKNDIVVQLSEWKSAYDMLLTGLAAEKGDGGRKNSITMLTIMFLYCRLLLRANCPADLTVFGACPNPSIQEILDLAETLIATSGENGSRNRRVVSAESGIIAPLFLIALKAGDRQLSSRAVDILARSNRREGPNDSKMMAEIVQKIRKLSSTAELKAYHENETCSQDVCNEWDGYNSDSTRSSDIALEFLASDIVDIPGGVSAMAKALGVDDNS